MNRYGHRWGASALAEAALGGPRGEGERLLRAGSLEAAVAKFQEALAADPQDARAMRSLSALMARAGDGAGARRLADRATALQPVSGPDALSAGAPTVLRTRAIEGGAWRVVKSKSRGWTRKFKGGHFSTQHLLRDGALNLHVVDLLAGDARAMDQAPTPDLLLNTIACADRASSTLAALADWTATRPELPVINRPERVMLTSRDQNARRLSGMDGVRFPRTVRLKVEGSAEATAGRLRASGLTAPIILRHTGRQTGRETVLCRDDAEVLVALADAGPEQELYAIQFVDTRDAAGRYRKMRVFAIDGALYPVACLTSDHWQIHSKDRYRLMTTDDESRRREQVYLTDPPSVVGIENWSALQRVFETLGLDFAGADFTVTPQGALVIFEANPAMRHNFDHAGAFPYTRPHLERITDAFTAMTRDRATAARVKRDLMPD